MNDELVSALLKDVGLRAVMVSAGALSRDARDKHEAGSASGALFAEALAGALLLASLQKEDARVQVQLECSGPMRGLFADAGSDGTVRGFVKNPHLAMTGTGEFRWRPVLGNSGFLSVLREMKPGEFYRSSVELEAFDFPQDLERYFTASEQTDSRVFIDVLGTAGEPIHQVVGLLLQPLPDGDRAVLKTLGDALAAGRFQQVLREAHAGVVAMLTALLGPDVGPLDIMSRYPVAYRCTCSRDRVYRALIAMGKEELRDLLQKDKQAEATCEFCTTRYVVTEEEIITLLKSLETVN